MTAKGTKRLNIVISELLHKELKVSAAQMGITLGQFVADAIQEKISKQQTGDKLNGKE